MRQAAAAVVAFYLIRKVHVAGRVDQIQGVQVAVLGGVLHARLQQPLVSVGACVFFGTVSGHVQEARHLHRGASPGPAPD